MGTSTNAILFYGIDYGEDMELDIDHVEEHGWTLEEVRSEGLEYFIRDVLKREMGLPELSGFPWHEYRQKPGESYTENRERTDEAYDAWKESDGGKAYREQEELIRQAYKDLGADQDYHCHHDHSMYYVSVTKMVAHRGYPVDIDPETDLQVPEDASEKLKRYCELAGLEYREPGWVLCSYWG